MGAVGATVGSEVSERLARSRGVPFSAPAEGWEGPGSDRRDRPNPSATATMTARTATIRTFLQRATCFLVRASSALGLDGFPSPAAAASAATSSWIPAPSS